MAAAAAEGVGGIRLQTMTMTRGGVSLGRMRGPKRRLAGLRLPRRCVSVCVCVCVCVCARVRMHESALGFDLRA